jgi:hypothetical protein
MADHPAALLREAAAALRGRSHRVTLADPAVAAALADWLDAYAERFAVWRGPHVRAELERALAVARAILGAGESHG